jgi:hypothetical protein
MGLTYDEATRSMFVQNLKAKMTEFNLEVVYLASPPNVSCVQPMLESPPRGVKNAAQLFCRQHFWYKHDTS